MFFPCPSAQKQKPTLAVHRQAKEMNHISEGETFATAVAKGEMGHGSWCLQGLQPHKLAGL